MQARAGGPAPPGGPHGRTTSPPLFDVMAVLGRTESLARLENQAPQG